MFLMVNQEALYTDWKYRRPVFHTHTAHNLYIYQLYEMLIMLIIHMFISFTRYSVGKERYSLPCISRRKCNTCFY